MCSTNVCTQLIIIQLWGPGDIMPPRGPERNGMKSHEENRVVSFAKHKRIAFDSLNMSRYEAMGGCELLASGGETTTV